MMNDGSGWSVISQWTGVSGWSMVVGLVRVYWSVISRRHQRCVLVSDVGLLHIFEGWCGVSWDKRLRCDVLGRSMCCVSWDNRLSMWCVSRDNRLRCDVLGRSMCRVSWDERLSVCCVSRWCGDDRCWKDFRWGCCNKFCRSWSDDFSDGYCTCWLRDDGVESIDSIGGLINGTFYAVSIINWHFSSSETYVIDGSSCAIRFEQWILMRWRSKRKGRERKKKH